MVRLPLLRAAFDMTTTSTALRSALSTTTLVALSALLAVRLLSDGASALAVGSPQDEPPSEREVEDLVEELFELREYEADERARTDAIVARLALLEPLDAKAEKDWRKELEKLWEDGPKLPKKGGEHHLFEDDRGRFFVDGRTRKPAGLLLGMHGGGQGSGDAMNSRSAYASAAGSLKLAAIFPEVLVKTEHGWTDSGTEEFVVELVERARRTFDVPPDKVFFSGHSMGGYGSWTLGGHHADLVAAIAPSAGAPTLVRDYDENIIGVVEGVIPNLRNVPIRVYQSGDDLNVPPIANDTAVEELAKADERWGGYDYEYWRVEGRGHDLPPGGTKALLEKVIDFERDPHPERVVWQPTLAWKRSFYWLWWDEPRPNAIVDARLDREANTIAVEVDGDASGLAVQLSAGVVDLDRELVVSLNGSEVFRGAVATSLAVLASTARTGDPGRTFVARIPLVP